MISGINSVLHVWAQAFTSICPVHGMTLRHLDVLECVANPAFPKGPDRGDMLAALELDRFALREVLQQLIDKGWIKNVQSKSNKRLCRFEMTEAGAKVFAKGQKAASQINAQLESRLGEFAFKTIDLALEELLGGIIDVMRKRT